MYLTFADLLDHVLAYAGTDASRSSTANHRRAVHNAIRVVMTDHPWAYLTGLGRVTTSAPYSTGTVAFDLTGGAAERQLTLTGGVWPAWAADGYVVVTDIPYEVDERVSDTVVTLEAATAPSADIAAGTAYEIRRDRYPLPADFVSGDECVINAVGTVLEYMHPRNWSGQRRLSSGPGQPWVFSYVGDPERVGSLGLVLWPPPDAEYAIDFLYRRRPRQLRYEFASDGTVSMAAGSATVTGEGTAFKAGMVGSVVRLSPDNRDLPTDETGGNPAAFEALVTAVASATSLTASAAAAEDLAGVRYVVTDPVDVEPAAMAEFLLRECERQYRLLARMVTLERGEEERAYQLARVRAMEADSRTTARAAADRYQQRRSGFSHYPMHLS